MKSEKIHQLNPKEHVDISSTNPPINLPEFLHFQSDHLLLTPQLISHPFYDRLRTSSTQQTSKFNRQSIPSQTTTNHPTVYSSIKRISRLRHSYDTVSYYEKQQKYPRRQKMSKFDSMSCFNEVSRLTIFLFLLVYSSTHNIYCLKENNEEHENVVISNNKI